jgi:sulfate adenylyltransferase
VLIHPSVGETKDGDIDFISRVRSYKSVIDNYLKDEAVLSLLPLAMRMAGPREALWHAIIRKNYGCTHFIVGRDHASPGKDAKGRPFYDPYAAQELVGSKQDEIGIAMVPFQEMVYVEEAGEYQPRSQVKPQQTIRSLSGTEFRQKLMDDQEIPAWFSFPEVIEELRRSQQRQLKTGLTIFLTGLPSAGKSTIAKILHHLLLEHQDKQVTVLDGDVVRQNLSRGLGFSKEDRLINIERIGFVASQITKHGGIAICAAIAPYEVSRRKNRQLINKHGTYVEVYISAPVSVCQERDVKGLYQKALTGQIKGMTGVDDPYEAPEQAEVVVDTVELSPAESAQQIFNYLAANDLIEINGASGKN